MSECIIVGIGGFIGTVFRYLIGLIPLKTDTDFPIKTLIINVIGAFLISFIVAISAKNKSVNPQIILMLRVGVCGGFTTFSTFAYETTELLENGNILTALGYICISVILSIIAVLIAQMLVQ